MLRRRALLPPPIDSHSSRPLRFAELWMALCGGPILGSHAKTMWSQMSLSAHPTFNPREGLR